MRYPLIATALLFLAGCASHPGTHKAQDGILITPQGVEVVPSREYHHRHRHTRSPALNNPGRGPGFCPPGHAKKGWCY